MKLPTPDLSPLARLVFEAYLRAWANANKANGPVSPRIDMGKGKPMARFVPRRGTVGTGPGRPVMPTAAATVAVNVGILLLAEHFPEWIHKFREEIGLPDREISQKHKDELMQLGFVILESAEGAQTQTAPNAARRRRLKQRFKGNMRFRIHGYTRARDVSTLPTP